MIRTAVTKGRIEEDAAVLLKKAGFDTRELEDKGRRLLFTINHSLEIVLAKAADVITYVEHGVCDMGIVGKDTIMEYGGSFYEVLDLNFGECKFALAGLKDKDFYAGYNQKVIATKYPNVAKSCFSEKGLDVKIIKIEGSVELAPLLGLADGIVDLVSSGETLRENGLVIYENLSRISARVIVNRASIKLKKPEIYDFINKISNRII
ncbi:MAG: ATP phosphoribosyltransferase [Oscillospiraceae bacterium]|nr:ATP phosphoribosyltransferase [Oscillospiraceae bacterium]